MIKTVNISSFQGEVPEEAEAGQRRYAHGPVYAPEDILALTAKEAINYWTRGASLDAQKWRLDLDDSVQLITIALNGGRFLYSEWCQQKARGPWAMCDAYSVTRLERHDYSDKNLTCTYYLKFAISKTGHLLLVASIHPEGA